MKHFSVPTWPELDAVLALEPVAAGHYRSELTQGNANGRVFGGQLLGQMAAACQAFAAQDRPLSMLQMTFLRGARIGRPLDYHVAELQLGKRIATYSVRGEQEGRSIVTGHASFQTTLDLDRWQIEPAKPAPAPEDLPDGTDIDPALSTRIKEAGFGGFEGGQTIQFRFVDPERELFPSAAGGPFRLWLRAAQTLPDDPALHLSALAYLSDWWFVYASLGSCLAANPGRRYYLASLNHSLWFHAPCRADDWLLYVNHSHHIGDARGLNVGHLYSRDGVHVATAVQECLQAPNDNAG